MMLGPALAARRRRLLRIFYPVPDPFDSAESWAQFAHQDLAAMARANLLRERDRVRFVLLFDDKPDSWYLERLVEITARLEEQTP